VRVSSHSFPERLWHFLVLFTFELLTRPSSFLLSIQAGSLTNLAKAPASTVQILGAEKALFRALKTKGNTPKYGLIYHSTFIGRAEAKNKGRISRYLANKCSIATRIDSFSDEPTRLYGEKLREQVEERLKFYETGAAPRRNVDVMQEVAKQLKVDDDDDDMEDAETPKKKDKKKKKEKKRKADSDEEEEVEEKEEKKSAKKAKKAKEAAPETPKSDEKEEKKSAKKAKKAKESAPETPKSDKKEKKVKTPKSEKKSDKKKKKSKE
jgi:nucleolar protein 56